jgi:hypothetical protein
LIEEEKILPGLVTPAPVGLRPGWATSNRENRFCVLNFATFGSEEGEKCYKDHLVALEASGKCAEVDMQFHFTGRIVSTEEYFGHGSKRPAKKPTGALSGLKAKTKADRLGPVATRRPKPCQTSLC